MAKPRRLVGKIESRFPAFTRLFAAPLVLWSRRFRWNEHFCVTKTFKHNF